MILRSGAKIGIVETGWLSAAPYLFATLLMIVAFRRWCDRADQRCRALGSFVGSYVVEWRNATTSGPDVSCGLMGVALAVSALITLAVGAEQGRVSTHVPPIVPVPLHGRESS